MGYVNIKATLSFISQISSYLTPFPLHILHPLLLQTWKKTHEGASQEKKNPKKEAHSLALSPLTQTPSPSLQLMEKETQREDCPKKPQRHPLSTPPLIPDSFPFCPTSGPLAGAAQLASQVLASANKLIGRGLASTNKLSWLRVSSSNSSSIICHSCNRGTQGGVAAEQQHKEGGGNSRLEGNVLEGDCDKFGKGLKEYDGL